MLTLSGVARAAGIAESAKLTGTGISELVGEKVALSSDGNTAVMGARGDNDYVGAAWLFTRTGSTWTKRAELTASGESGAGQFGSSVAISPDGGTVMIGASADNGGAGAVYVFTGSGSMWSQQQRLTPSGSGQFGSSVALGTNAGDSALIGATGNGGGAGAVYVFTRSSGNWTEQGSPLTGSGESGGGQFGASVAMSPDAGTAIVGGPGDASGLGAAWTFTSSNSGTSWSQQGSKLTGGSEVGAAHFGQSVALSSTTNGDNTALIGGSNDNPHAGTAAGAAWVFTRSSSTWSQQAKLTQSGSQNLGSGVALSGDGNIAVVGANGGDGDAYVFTRSMSTWTEQTDFTASFPSDLNGPNAELGYAVALSSDGGTALTGAPGDNADGGAGFVFTGSGSSWTEQSKLLVSGLDGATHFGVSEAMSSDGSTALVGARNDTGGLGAVWVYTRSGGTWTRQAKLAPTSGATPPSSFGSSVALSANGNTALIGAPGDNGELGAVWVFTRSGSAWTQQQQLVETGATPGLFGFIAYGSSVSLSSDGNTAVVGAEFDGGSGGNGAAWIFSRSGTTWSQVGLKHPSPDASANFGTSVAMAPDGNSAIIGAPGDPRGPALAVGAAWELTRSGNTWSIVQKLTASDEPGSGEFGSSVAISGDGGTAMIGGIGGPSGLGGGLWAFTRSGTGPWSQQGNAITAREPSQWLGQSVALSSDGNTAVAGGPLSLGNGVSEAGGAWEFTRSNGAWSEQGGQLSPSDESGPGHFGAGVALSGDGTQALIGANQDTFNTGAAWVFSGQPGTTTPPPTTTPTNPPPVTVSHASLGQIKKGKPKLSFTLNGTSPIKKIAIHLAKGLKFSAKKKQLLKGIKLTGRGKRLKFKVKLAHGTLTITLKHPLKLVHVTIAKPALTVSKALVKQLQRHKKKSLKIKVTVTTSNGAKQVITLSLR